MLAIAFALSLAATVVFFFSWLQDRLCLRRVAREVTQGLASTEEKVEVLSHWVYHNQGFDKNKRYFLIGRLGPTPVQVLQLGGDCADKSRLLSALLAEIGVRSGLVMIFSPAGEAIHTVVEAEHGGRRIVLDPVWDVVYKERGRWYGVEDLAGNRIGCAIVRKLVAERGPASKVAYMPESEMCFDYAQRINFRKNRLLAAIAWLIDNLGSNHRTVLRPRLLEDPKRFLLMGLTGWSALLGAVLFMVGS